jgi:hypothetical protein
VSVRPSRKEVAVPSDSLAGLLLPLKAKAHLYVAAAAGTGGSSAGGSGGSGHAAALAAMSGDELFLALLGLARDIEEAAGVVEARAARWALAEHRRQQQHAAAATAALAPLAAAGASASVATPIPSPSAAEEYKVVVETFEDRYAAALAAATAAAKAAAAASADVSGGAAKKGGSAATGGGGGAAAAGAGMELDTAAEGDAADEEDEEDDGYGDPYGRRRGAGRAPFAPTLTLNEMGQVFSRALQAWTSTGTGSGGGAAGSAGSGSAASTAGAGAGGSAAGAKSPATTGAGAAPSLAGAGGADAAASSGTVSASGFNPISTAFAKLRDPTQAGYAYTAERCALPAPRGGAAASSSSSSSSAAAAVSSATALGAGSAAAPSGASTDLVPGAGPYRVPPPLEAQYRSLLRPEAFSTMEGLTADHALTSGQKRSRGKYGGGGSGESDAAGAGAGGPDPKRLMRVSAEMSNLPDLALSWGSSVFVRNDEAAMDVMRAYMTGPAGTPYENGWLGFDIKLPPSYPQEPPKVEYITTGGGACRFNPNL